MALILTPGQFTQRAEFYHQLAQLTSAGISLIQALEQLQRNPPDRSFREPLRLQLEKIKAGGTFTESLLATSGWLPPFDIALIEAGERSGRMDDCFRLLAEYYHERARITKQALSQLVYPAGLVHVAALVFLIIVPFAGSQFNASLPLLLLKAALMLAPVYLGAALMVYAFQSRHGQSWRALMEKLLGFVPLLGKARRFLALARLALAIEALISAGVNIVQAWEIAANACGSPALRRAILAWKPQVAAGTTPADAVGNCRLFPEMFANSYRSGEVSGKLDEALRRLHRYYHEEGSRKLQAFAEWTPRLIYGLVAVIIGYEIIHFYSSLYGPHSDLSNLLNGF